MALNNIISIAEIVTICCDLWLTIQNFAKFHCIALIENFTLIDCCLLLFCVRNWDVEMTCVGPLLVRLVRLSCVCVISLWNRRICVWFVVTRWDFVASFVVNFTCWNFVCVICDGSNFTCWNRRFFVTGCLDANCLQKYMNVLWFGLRYSLAMSRISLDEIDVFFVWYVT